jgi:hypothetical protein
MMKRAQELGLKDMNKDMFLALICIIILIYNIMKKELYFTMHAN